MEYYSAPNSFDAVRRWITPFQKKVVWEPFPGPHKLLVRCLQKYNLNVYYYEENEDAFSIPSIFNWRHCDLIVTNPPFFRVRDFFHYALKYSIPFIIVLPVQVFATKYYHKLFKSHGDCLSITFTRQIHFINSEGKSTLPGFATCFLGYKVGSSKFVDD